MNKMNNYASVGLGIVIGNVAMGLLIQADVRVFSISLIGIALILYRR